MTQLRGMRRDGSTLSQRCGAAPSRQIRMGIPSARVPPRIFFAKPRLGNLCVVRFRRGRFQIRGPNLDHALHECVIRPLVDPSGFPMTPHNEVWIPDQDIADRPRLWENAWDEAADALCFPRESWMPGRSSDACGLNEAIRSRSPLSAVPVCTDYAIRT